LAENDLKTIKAILREKIDLFYQMTLAIIVCSVMVVSIFLGVMLAKSENENISLKSEKFIQEFSKVITDIENQYNPEIRKLLEFEYDNLLDKLALNRIKEAILNHKHDPYQIENINYYRISENLYIYETDYPPDLGLDLSTSESFKELMTRMKPGDIYQDNLISEVKTGRLKNFSYIKLDDGSFFEIGISFKEIQETIDRITFEVFGRDDINIQILGSFTGENEPFFKKSYQSGEPYFQMIDLLNSRYFVSQDVNHRIYRIMIDIPFVIPLFSLLFALSVMSVMITFSGRMKQTVLKMANEMSSEIEKVESNLKNFSLVKQLAEPQPVKTSIYEINSISNSFLKLYDEIHNSYDELNAMNEELEESVMRNKDLLEQLEKVLNLPDYLQYIDNFEKFLHKCFMEVSTFINSYDYAYVATVENDKYKFLDTRGIAFNVLKQIRIKVEDRDRSDSPRIIDYKEDYFVREPLKQFQSEFNQIGQALSIPVSSRKIYYGNITFFKKKDGERFTREELKIASYFYQYLKGYLIIRELSQLESEVQKEMLHAMIKILEKHDSYTRGHSESVADLSSEFAEFLGFDEKQVQDIYWAGIVHDTGKILIPNTVLNKPKRLTEEEFKLIKKHPVYAYDVLKDSNAMKDIAVYIRHHHEWFDGRGYPDGLSGEKIPIESRLIALVDSWDAMISDRIYKKGISEENAIKEIERFAGVQFDPDLVEKWKLFLKSKGFSF
jgi:HD-GYP domain-containing protein (c-di-GMP phosphodiesterase class II)